MVIDVVQIEHCNFNTLHKEQSTTMENLDINPMIEESTLPVINVNLNGENLQLEQKEDKSPYIFADMISYTNIDPTKPQGNIFLSHNGQDATYTGIINDGDILVIKWQNDYF